jgi:hypothetical protein
MVVSFSAHDLQSLHSPPAKTASSQQLAQRWQPFAMRPVNLRSCINVKAMYVSALQLPNVSLVYVTPFLSVPHSQCKLALQLRS